MSALKIAIFADDNIKFLEEYFLNNIHTYMSERYLNFDFFIFLNVPVSWDFNDSCSQKFRGQFHLNTWTLINSATLKISSRTISTEADIKTLRRKFDFLNNDTFILDKSMKKLIHKVRHVQILILDAIWPCWEPMEMNL